MINLSYILTTRNKIEYLKVTLENLINNRLDDEEIIVIDGNSTDGTKVYLEELFFSGRIQNFISENDQGESHGFNKGFLIAKGKLIKIITDDDFFNYKIINQCKEFMLKNPNCDLLIGQTYNTHFENFDSISSQSTVRTSYLEWLTTKKPFAFTGLSIMINRTSLPLLGLFDCTSAFPDTEFSFRVTSLNINLVWCEYPIVIRIDNSKSNLRNYSNYKKEYETDRILYYYDKRYWHSKNNFIQFIYYKLNKSRLVLTSKMKMIFQREPIRTKQAITILEFFEKCSNWVENKKCDFSSAFLTNL